MSKLSRIFPGSGMIAVILAASLSLSPIFASAADEFLDSADATATAAPQAEAMSSPWPVQLTGNGRTFLVYQPQVDKWDNGRIEGRSAVSMRNDAGGPQNFGVLFFSARADVDSGSRTVTVHDAVVSKADFPAVTAGLDDYLSVLRPQFAAQTWQVAQDRLQSDMEIDRLSRQASKQPLNNDPPRILYSERPAILVPIDGNPVLSAVADTGLTRVTNTRALVLRDTATSWYYLFVSDHWMVSKSLDGPWSVAANPSPQLERAKQVATQQDQVDLLVPDTAQGTVPLASPQIVVSTVPTELLQTDGPAQYAPIERTQLLYVTNSPNKLFLDLRTQIHYALISGRWYRTASLAQSQWSYVPAATLPSDFAMIPADHPTESVRTAVPGTPQAREAVIANSVPQMATVARNAAQLDVAYDGNPVFQPIEGTTLQYAVNSPVPVIRVSEESFYALDNGVWFVASSPFGPWAVTSYVPAVIYSIPRSSPLYYVTAVRVYDATPEVVYVGYTPGYVGSYVSSDNVVVYGTGWPYQPWIGSVWYGAPVTWGFGFSYVYSWWRPYPWFGWRRVAWVPAPPCFRPWWGPWHAPVYGRGPRGFVAGGVNAIRPAGPGWHNVGRIYNRWDRRSVVWSGPAQLQRPPSQAFSRPTPGSGFVVGPDGRRRQVGNDVGGVRRDQQLRDQIAILPKGQVPRADQTLPAVQAPWRRPPQFGNRGDHERAQSGQPRVQPPSFADNERRPVENTQFVPRERGFDRRRANEATPRMRVDGGPGIERPRAIVNQQRPVQALPPAQAPQRMPPVAGVPIERMPSQPQVGRPALRNFSAPAGRVERPAISNPVRVERPAVNAGRIAERIGAQPQMRGNEGRGQSNSGGGRGRWGAGADHR